MALVDGMTGGGRITVISKLVVNFYSNPKLSKILGLISESFASIGLSACCTLRHGQPGKEVARFLRILRPGQVTDFEWALATASAARERGLVHATNA